MNTPALVSRHVLSTERLSKATARALAEIVRDGTPKATRRALGHAVRYWQAWHQLRFGTPLPLPRAAVSGTAVLQFLADHVRRHGDDGAEVVELPEWADAELVRVGVKRSRGPLSHNTVKQRLALLATMHNTLDLPNPLRYGQVQQIMAAANAAQGRAGAPSGAAAPLSASDMDRAIDACEDTPQGRRDRALLTVLFDTGGRRRGEIRGLQLDGCDRRSEGYVLSFPRIKAKANASTLGKPLRVPLRLPQALALDAWIATLAEAGITTGPVFVPVRGVYKPAFGSKGLSGHAVNRILKKRLKAAGVEGHYSAHSVRKGFATDRLDRGESYATVQAMTDHADPRTLVRNYYRPQDVLDNPAAARSDREA